MCVLCVSSWNLQVSRLPSSKTFEIFEILRNFLHPRSFSNFKSFTYFKIQSFSNFKSFEFRRLHISEFPYPIVPVSFKFLYLQSFTRLKISPYLGISIPRNIHISTFSLPRKFTNFHALRVVRFSKCSEIPKFCALHRRVCEFFRAFVPISRSLMGWSPLSTKAIWLPSCRPPLCKLENPSNTITLQYAQTTSPDEVHLRSIHLLSLDEWK